MATLLCGNDKSITYGKLSDFIMFGHSSHLNIVTSVRTESENSDSNSNSCKNLMPEVTFVGEDVENKRENKSENAFRLLDENSIPTLDLANNPDNASSGILTNDKEKLINTFKEELIIVK